MSNSAACPRNLPPRSPPAPLRISVVVLNWNGRHHLEICLPALAAQTRPADQVIVVDNHSTRDDSLAFLAAEHPWVRVVALPENRGFAGGNNAALPFTRGDAVVLLNNDTRPEPDFLEQLERCALAHPEAGIIAAHLTDWTGVCTDSAGDGCKTTGRGYGRHRGQPAASAPPSGPVFGACAGAALYRRELIEDVGFLDDEFFMNFEDTDLALRACLRGWQAWFCREAVVRHRISASQEAGSELNVYYGARNHLWVCAKNLSASLLWRNAPLIAAEIVAMFLAALRRRRGAAYLRGLGAGAAGWARMRRKRSRLGVGAHTTREFESQLTPRRLSLRALQRLWNTGSRHR